MADNIKVAIRVRCLLEREKKQGRKPLWEARDDGTIRPIDGSQAPFAFDSVYGEKDTNEQIYEQLVSPIVQDAVKGIHGTFMAYGQTASGKTYTMLGKPTSSISPGRSSQSMCADSDNTFMMSDPNQMGVLHFVAQDLYSLIDDTRDRIFLLRVSYIEIYNESVRDLLADQNNKRVHNLNVMEDCYGDIVIKDITDPVVMGPADIIKHLIRGEANRCYGVTNMNEKSSRSHTIFRIIVESRERNDNDRDSFDMTSATQVSCLNLVDLAGSENASQTGATGQRLHEGGFINKSLLTLSNVISQLATKKEHISFRDSKLTRILQNSLGGNSKTAIVCAVTPAVYEETLSTIKFAQNAKRVTNKAIVNEVMSGQPLISQYLKTIAQLKLELKQAKDMQPELMGLENKELQMRLIEQEVGEKDMKEKLDKLLQLLSNANRFNADDGNVSSMARVKRRETWCPGKGRPSSVQQMGGFKPFQKRGDRAGKEILPFLAEESAYDLDSDSISEREEARRRDTSHFDSALFGLSANSVLDGEEIFVPVTFSKEVQTGAELLHSLISTSHKTAGAGVECVQSTSSVVGMSATSTVPLSDVETQTDDSEKLLNPGTLPALAESEKKIEQLEETLKNTEQEYTERMDEKEKEIISLKHLLKAAKRQSMSFVADISMNDLSADAVDVTRKISGAATEIANYKTERLRLIETNNDLLQLNEDLVTQNAEISDSLQKANKKLGEVTAKYSELTSELNDLKISYNDLMTEYNDLSELTRYEKDLREESFAERQRITHHDLLNRIQSLEKGEPGRQRSSVSSIDTPTSLNRTPGHRRVKSVDDFIGVDLPDSDSPLTQSADCNQASQTEILSSLKEQVPLSEQLQQWQEEIMNLTEKLSRAESTAKSLQERLQEQTALAVDAEQELINAKDELFCSKQTLRQRDSLTTELRLRLEELTIELTELQRDQSQRHKPESSLVENQQTNALNSSRSINSVSYEVTSDPIEQNTNSSEHFSPRAGSMIAVVADEERVSTLQQETSHIEQQCESLDSGENQREERKDNEMHEAITSATDVGLDRTSCENSATIHSDMLQNVVNILRRISSVVAALGRRRMGDIEPLVVAIESMCTNISEVTVEKVSKVAELIDTLDLVDLNVALADSRATTEAAIQTSFVDSTLPAETSTRSVEQFCGANVSHSETTDDGVAAAIVNDLTDNSHVGTEVLTGVAQADHISVVNSKVCEFVEQKSEESNRDICTVFELPSIDINIESISQSSSDMSTCVKGEDSVIPATDSAQILTVDNLSCDEKKAMKDSFHSSVFLSCSYDTGEVFNSPVARRSRQTSVVDASCSPVYWSCTSDASTTMNSSVFEAVAQRMSVASTSVRKSEVGGDASAEEMHNTIEGLRSELKSAKSQLVVDSNRELEYKRQCGHAEEIIKEINASNAKIIKENNADIGKLQSEVSDITGRLRKVECDLQLSEHRLNQSQREVSDLKAELTSAHEALRIDSLAGSQGLKRMGAMTDQDIARLMDRFKKLTTQNDLTSQRCEKLEAKIKEMEVASRKYPEVELERNSYMNQLSDSREQLDKARAEIHRLQLLYNMSFSEEAPMKLKLSKLEINLDQAKKQRLGCEETIRELNADKELLIKEAKTHLQELEVLKTTNIELRKNLEELEANQSKQQLEVDGLVERIKYLESQKVELEHEKEKELEELKCLVEQASAGSQNVEELSKLQEEYNQKCLDQKLMIEQQYAEQLKDVQAEERNNFQVEVEKCLKEKEAEIQAVRDSLVTEFDKERRDVEQKVQEGNSETLRALEEERDALKQEIEKLNSVLSDMNTQQESEQDKLTNLNTVDELKQSMTEEFEKMKESEIEQITVKIKSDMLQAKEEEIALMMTEMTKDFESRKQAEIDTLKNALCEQMKTDFETEKHAEIEQVKAEIFDQAQISKSEEILKIRKEMEASQNEALNHLEAELTEKLTVVKNEEIEALRLKFNEDLATIKVTMQQQAEEAKAIEMAAFKSTLLQDWEDVKLCEIEKMKSEIVLEMTSEKQKALDQLKAEHIQQQEDVKAAATAALRSELREQFEKDKSAEFERLSSEIKEGCERLKIAEIDELKAEQMQKLEDMQMCFEKEREDEILSVREQTMKLVEQIHSNAEEEKAQAIESFKVEYASRYSDNTSSCNGDIFDEIMKAKNLLQIELRSVQQKLADAELDQQVKQGRIVELEEKMCALKEMMNKYEEELDSLRSQLFEKHKEITNKDEELHHLEGILSEREEQLINCGQEIEQGSSVDPKLFDLAIDNKQDTPVQNDQTTSVTTSSSYTVSCGEEMQSRCQSLETRIGELNAELCQLRAILNEKNEEIDKIQKSAQENIDKLLSAENSHKTVLLTIEGDYKKEIELLKEEQSNNVKILIEDHCRKISQQREDCDIKIQEYQSKISNLKSSSSETVGQLTEELNAKIVSLEESHLTEIDRMQHALQQKTKELEEMRERLSTSSDKLLEVSALKETAQRELEEVKSRLREVSSRDRSSEERWLKVKEHLESKISELEEERKSTVEQLEDEKNKYCDKNELLVAELMEQEQRYSEVEDQYQLDRRQMVGDYESKITRLQENNDQLIVTADEREETITGLTKEVLVLKNELAEKTNTVSSLTAKINELEATVTKLTAEIRTFETDYNDVVSINEIMNQTMVDHENKIQELEKALASKVENDQKSGSSRNAKLELQQDLNRIRGERNNAVIKATDLQKLLKEERLSAGEKEAALQKKLTEAENRLKEMESKLSDALAGDSIALRKELYQMRTKAGRLEQKLYKIDDSYCQKIMVLRTQRDDLEAYIRRLEDDIRKLRAQQQQHGTSGSGSFMAATPSSAGACSDDNSASHYSIGSGSCGDLIIVQLKAQLVGLQKEKTLAIRERDKESQKTTELQRDCEKATREKTTLKSNIELLEKQVSRFREHMKTCPALQESSKGAVSATSQLGEDEDEGKENKAGNSRQFFDVFSNDDTVATWDKYS